MRFDVPVDPDADTARQWARDELAKPEYTQGSGTNWIQRFFDWFTNLIANLANNATGGWNGWGLLAVVVAVAAVVALITWLIVGPMRRSRRRGEAEEELGDPTLSAADLLAAASKAAAAEDWDTAVIEAYRALIRSLDERDAIDARPGMTAFEAALTAGAAIPAIASAVGEDADVFDAVRYGHLAATRSHYEHVLATRTAAGRAKVEVPA